MNRSNSMLSVLKKFSATKELLCQVVLSFGNLMGAGLAYDYALNPKGPDGKTDEFKKPLLMLPSHVSRIPTGNETGSYLAIDLGGSNIRICVVTLMKDGNIVKATTDEEIAQLELKASADMAAGKASSHSIVHCNRHRCVQAHYRIPSAVKTSQLNDLMGFIAFCIITFLCEYNHCAREKFSEFAKNIVSLIPNSINGEKDAFFDGPIPTSLGFTFSFPVRQISLVESELITWTKGFSIADAIGQDVAKALQSELKKLSLDILVSALINDTVGTLLAHAYEEPETNLAVILGTGTNAAYIEKRANITKLAANSSNDKEDEMIINIEWGAYHAVRDIMPATRADQLVDENSLNPRKQLFEKMVSGMYLGEITRYTLIELIECDSSMLFGGKGSASGKAAIAALSKKDVLGTDIMQRIDDAESPAESARRLREEFTKRVGITVTDDKDCSVVCEVISAVRQRAARLSAAAIYAVLNKMNSPDTRTGKKAVVAIDGTLFLKYEKFKLSLNQALEELFTEEEYSLVKLCDARDGSGMGAAIVAAVYTP